MRRGTLERRLRRIEAAHGFKGDLAHLTDAQLDALVRDCYRDLAAQHGGLTQAAEALRLTGNADDAALALLIEEEIGRDAQQH